MQKDKEINVLQVYALTGLGHLREATSLKNALDNAGVKNHTLDILYWAKNHSYYSKVAVLPLLFFKWFFEFSTKNTSYFNKVTPPKFVLKVLLYTFRILEIPLGFSLRRYLIRSKFNVYLAVHPWGLGALWSFGLGRNIKKRMVNSIPDEIDEGSASFYAIPGRIDGPIHLVNSKRVKNLLVEIGVNDSNILITGHTLDPNVLNKREKIFNRVQKNINSDKPLCLGLYIGGTGTYDEMKRIKSIISTLSKNIKLNKYTIKAIPGPHTAFGKELQSLKAQLNLSDSQLEIYSSPDRNKVIKVGHEWFINDIDVLFAKTGEIIFYSLATGIPHIHFPPKGSNEVEHVKLMKSYSAIYEYDKINNLDDFLADKKNLLSLSKNAYEANYKLNGAEKTVDIIKKLYSSN